jgi:rod shape-determining protein MreC
MNKKSVAVFLIAIFFIFLNKIFFCKYRLVERGVAIAIYPVFVVAHHIHNSLSKLFGKSFCYEKIFDEKLQQRYDELFQKYVKLQTTVQFERNTKELVEFQKRYDLKNAIVSRVLSRDFSKKEHFLLINRGSRDGVKSSMVAIYKFQIVGKVVDVYDFYSKVQCITDKQCSIASFTNTTNAQGIIEGTNKINECKLNFISYTSKLLDKDLVFCSGQGMIFPQGFCLGTIKSHQCNKDEAYHSIEVEPLVDFTTLKFCFLTDISKISLF